MGKRKTLKDVKPFKGLSHEQIMKCLKARFDKQTKALQREAADVLKNPKKHYCNTPEETQRAVDRLLYQASCLKFYRAGKYDFKYFPRLKIFRDRDGNEFNPATGEHSANYGACTLLKGKMLVKDCEYHLANLLDLLGIDYLKVHAPMGVTRLNSSVKSLAEMHASYVIQAKYGRGDQKWRLKCARDAAQDIQFLETLGAKIPPGILEKCIADADAERTEKLKNDADWRFTCLERDLERARKSEQPDLRAIVQLTNKFEKQKKKREAETIEADVSVGVAQ